MDIVTGTLVKKDASEIQANEVLQNAEIVGFYFSAHWCPPCRAFTPILAKAYQEMKNLNYKFEVIFVSSDRDEKSLFEYMNECHGDWFALPFGSEVITKLETKYNITGIPTLVIVKKDGTVVTEDGDCDIESKGAEAYKDWIK